MRTTSLLVAVAVLTACGVAAPPVGAEWFGDIYVGAALTPSEDVDARLPGASVTLKDVDFETSLVYGARVGYWFERLTWLGVAVDISTFNPDVESQSITATAAVAGFEASTTGRLRDLDLWIAPISLDVLFRIPLLTSAAFPKGRLQPYVAVGPVLYVAEAEDHGNLTTGDDTDFDVGLGAKAAGGVTWLLTKDIGLFAEYRFTHISPEFSFRDVDLGRVRLEGDLNTHHLLLGISARF